MTLLVFGKGGQLSTELQRCTSDAVFLGQDEADLARPEACAARIAELRPAAVINSAAWTAVDAAEDAADEVSVVNADAPAAMAEACASIGAAFVHISTDYVFDGSGDTPWSPEDTTSPLGVYGRTKRDGEIRIAGIGGTFAILRTSWVFSAHGGNFVKTMLRLARDRDRLTIVGDQIGGPTPAADLAKACLRAVDVLSGRPEASGVYHFAGQPDTSWAEFAREIYRQTGDEVDVVDIPSSEYPTPAVRPLNSRLDCSTTEQVLGIMRPDWRDGLHDVLNELGAGT